MCIQMLHSVTPNSVLLLVIFLFYCCIQNLLCLKISFAVKIVPSPDWFVGVNSYSLHEGDDWVTHKELELWPLDGGSQRGRKSIRILHILRTRL